MLVDQGTTWICLKQTLNICSNFLRVIFYMIHLQLFQLIFHNFLFKFSGLVEENLFITIKIILKVKRLNKKNPLYVAFFLYKVNCN